MKLKIKKECISNVMLNYAIIDRKTVPPITPTPNTKLTIEITNMSKKRLNKLVKKIQTKLDLNVW
jgi:hypothetical protein